MDSSLPDQPQRPPAEAEIAAYYERGFEAPRLTTGPNQIEFARTQDILLRTLPPPPAVIYDVGGGAGVYACWLARRGYAAHLVDIMPLHIEQARAASRAQPAAQLASFTVGDARRLDRADASVDAVLLLGPLYHLTERADRVTALREAARVTRPGGVVCAAAISRHASALDGLLRGFLTDPTFRAILQEDLRSGQHRNLADQPSYFTTAYFHQPHELRAEFEAAGLDHAQTVAVEGPAGVIANAWERWDEQEWRERVLDLLRELETEPALLGASPHLLAIGRKP
jgi:ubiquinone/menaquinone biosynthesis C-methylase UbiE